MFSSLSPPLSTLIKSTPTYQIEATDRVLIFSVAQVRYSQVHLQDLGLGFASVTSFYAAESEYSLWGLDRYIPRIPNRMTHSFPLRPYF